MIRVLDIMHRVLCMCEGVLTVRDDRLIISVIKGLQGGVLFLCSEDFQIDNFLQVGEEKMPARSI